jgi:hypothetical protein
MPAEVSKTRFIGTGSRHLLRGKPLGAPLRSLSPTSKIYKRNFIILIETLHYNDYFLAELDNIIRDEGRPFPDG